MRKRGIAKLNMAMFLLFCYFSTNKSGNARLKPDGRTANRLRFLSIVIRKWLAIISKERLDFRGYAYHVTVKLCFKLSINLVGLNALLGNFFF